MPETLLDALKITLFLSLFLVKFGQGVKIKPGDLRFFRDRRVLMVKSVLAVDILVPAVFLLILLIIRPPRPVSVGLAILAASPAAPFAFWKVHRAGGHLAYAASLQFVLAVLVPLTAPLVLLFFSRALGVSAGVHPSDVALQVFAAQLLPIGLGIFAGARSKRVIRLGTPLIKAATLILILLLLVILLYMHEAFLELGARSYAAVVLSAAGAVAVGHIMSPKEPGMRTALAVETAMRNPGLALLIATLNFPQARPLPILVPIAIVSSLVVTVYANWQNRKPTGLNEVGLTPGEEGRA